MMGGGRGNPLVMGDWRYELSGLTAQDRLRAVKVYETVADSLARGGLRRSPRAELRRLATVEGLEADHQWIGVAAQELELRQQR